MAGPSAGEAGPNRHCPAIHRGTRSWSQIFTSGQAGLWGQPRPSRWSSTRDVGTDESWPPRAQPQQSAGTRAQSMSWAHSASGGRGWQAHTRQPSSSRMNPPSHCRSHATGLQRSVHRPCSHTASTAAQPAGSWHSTSLHAPPKPSLVGRAMLGHSQQDDPASSQSMLLRHSCSASAPSAPPPAPGGSATSAEVSSARTGQQPPRSAGTHPWSRRMSHSRVMGAHVSRVRAADKQVKSRGHTSLF